MNDTERTTRETLLRAGVPEATVDALLASAKRTERACSTCGVGRGRQCKGAAHERTVA